MAPACASRTTVLLRSALAHACLPPSLPPHRSFWYAAALSEEVVAGKPQGVGLAGRQFVLFRGEDGRVSCLDDVCPHR